MISFRIYPRSVSDGGITDFKCLSFYFGFGFLLLAISVTQFSPILKFLFFIAFLLVLIYSKLFRPKAPDTFPVISIFWTADRYFHMLRNRAKARILFVEMLLGFCAFFAKEGMYLLTLFTEKILILYNPEEVNFVLRSIAFVEKKFPYNLGKSLFKEGLLTSGRKKWHDRRRLLTPAFHFKIVENFIPDFNKESNIFVKRLHDLMQTQESVDIVPLASRCAMDTVLETVMGTRLDEQEARVDEYLEAYHTWSKCLADRMVFPWLWFDFIFHRTKCGKTSLKCLDTLAKCTNGIIEDRLREVSKRPRDRDVFPSSPNDIGRKTTRQLALLDLLLDLHMKDKSVSLQDIAEEVDTFIPGGHDSTGLALSWTLYLLGLYQNIQKKAQEEVDAVLGDDADRIITIPDINKLKYLLCVLKESMRLYPPVPLIARIVNEDSVIGGHQIKKGTNIVIPIHKLHRNPENFPNPEEFNPERFSPENIKNMDPFAYIPFSAGPRNCIGSKFAIREMITILATVLRHFNVKSAEHRDKVLWPLGLFLTPQNGLHLTFTDRQFLRYYSAEEQCMAVTDLQRQNDDEHFTTAGLLCNK